MRNLPLIGLCAAALLACAPASFAGGKKAIWGPLEEADGSSALPIYEQLGVRYLQTSLAWSSIAPVRPARPTDPSDPAYQWPSGLDEAIRAARKRGIRIALMVARSPSWANGGRAPEWAPRNRAFANFLTAAARRYRGVRHWMIWGEPNRLQRLQAATREEPRRSPALRHAAARRLPGPQGGPAPEHRDRRYVLHVRRGLPTGLGPLDAPPERQARAARLVRPQPVLVPVSRLAFRAAARGSGRPGLQRPGHLPRRASRHLSRRVPTVPQAGPEAVDIRVHDLLGSREPRLQLLRIPAHAGALADEPPTAWRTAPRTSPASAGST